MTKICEKIENSKNVSYNSFALDMLPELFRNPERAALGCAVWSGFLRLRELLLLSRTLSRLCWHVHTDQSFCKFDKVLTINEFAIIQTKYSLFQVHRKLLGYSRENTSKSSPL